MELTGNTILITGATSGIGLGLAKAFWKSNNKVIICGRRKERLEAIEEKHSGMITRVCDLLKEEERVQLHKWITTNHPELNVLVNNAGIQLKFDLAHPVNMDRVRSEMDINFNGPVHLSSLFAEQLSDKQNAAIINISSGLAFTPKASMPVYCASKAALHSYTLSLRYQLANTKVKVFEIIPPSVDTELGLDHREDPSQTHGGMPVDEFIEKTMGALENDKFEAAIGQSQNLYMKREELFGLLNR